MLRILRAAINVTILVVLVVVAAVFISVYMRAHESCTVGINLAAASVTVDGPGANAQCAAIVAGAPGVGYQYQANVQPGGAVLCQANVQDDVFTVRDQGVATAAGRAMCVYLQTIH